MRALVLALVVMLWSGCLNEFEDVPEPHLMRIAGIDVSAPVVSSGSVLLVVNVSLDNMGGRSPPARLEVKAYDEATDLLVVTNATDVGPVPEDETRLVTIGIRVPRESSYRIRVGLFEDQRLVQTGDVLLNGLGALERNLFETGLRIAEMDFLVRNASGGRVGIDVRVYVTNEAADDSKALRMKLKAREVSTSLLADEKWVDVGAVRPEQTGTVEARLDVPGGYNYVVEGVLWDDDFIVGRGQGNVQLLPTFTKPTNADVVVSTPQIDDFVRPVVTAPGSSEEPTDGPGLAAVVVALALAVSLMTPRRRKP